VLHQRSGEAVLATPYGVGDFGSGDATGDLTSQAWDSEDIVNRDDCRRSSVDGGVHVARVYRVLAILAEAEPPWALAEGYPPPRTSPGALAASASPPFFSHPEAALNTLVGPSA
jgi:hypothetical protein